MTIPYLASKINLSNQGLTSVPFELLQCKNLKKLNLSNNKIKVIPAELIKLKQLRSLDLSNNEISTLYAKNFDFPKLEVLILKNNKIKKLPWQIGSLASLKKLNVSGNLLSALPDEIKNMSELTEISIASNVFSIFPQPILQLPKLSTCWLNNNQLTDFPVSAIKDCLPALKALYCFSPLNNMEVDSIYKSLQGTKGNAIGKLNLLALKSKAKPVIADSKIERQKKMETPKKSLFISYCHADTEWLSKINTALQTMAYEGLEMESWDDTMLNAGDKWKQEIEVAIEKADIAILLVSNNFLASKFIREHEVPKLLKKAEENGTKILPVIVGLCRFTQSVIKDYQAVNKPERPMNALLPHEQDKIIYDLTLAIDKVLSKL